MISHGAQEILRKMRAAEDAEDFGEAELVREGSEVWLGYWKTTSAIVNELLRHCLIRDDSEQGKGIERYTINEDGRKAADDRAYVPAELRAALGEGPAL